VGDHHGALTVRDVHNLGNMQSSSTDVYPNTQTFTFCKATYTSPYIVFKPDEYYSNQVERVGQRVHDAAEADTAPRRPWSRSTTAPRTSPTP
jgi:hypothetical protein